MRTRVLGWSALAALLMAALGGGTSAFAAAVPYIGVQFYFPQNGRGNYVPPDFSTPALAPTQEAGQVLQDNFNPIALNGTAQATTGSDLPLNDAAGHSTAVTLSFTANSAWYTSQYPATPNETLLAAESKTSGGGDTANYTLNNVAAGTYDLLVYIANDDASLVNANYTVGAQTFYVSDEAGNSDTFTQASNMDPLGTRDVGNYVEFDGLTPTLGAITLTAISPSGGNLNASVNGFQLLEVPIIPEPASISMLSVAAIGLLVRRKRPQNVRSS